MHAAWQSPSRQGTPKRRRIRGRRPAPWLTLALIASVVGPAVASAETIDDSMNWASAVDIAAGRYSMFPAPLLMKDQFRSDLAISKLDMPVLIPHGEQDQVVPIEYGRRLSALGGDNITFVAIAQAGHVVFGEREAQEHVRRWLSEIPTLPAAHDKTELKRDAETRTPFL
jgi:pimeloyl-ACP methyl ester carboxylesterase